MRKKKTAKVSPEGDYHRLPDDGEEPLTSSRENSRSRSPFLPSPFSSPKLNNLMDENTILDDLEPFPSLFHRRTSPMARESERKNFPRSDPIVFGDISEDVDSLSLSDNSEKERSIDHELLGVTSRINRIIDSHEELETRSICESLQTTIRVGASHIRHFDKYGMYNSLLQQYSTWPSDRWPESRYWPTPNAVQLRQHLETTVAQEDELYLWRIAAGSGEKLTPALFVRRPPPSSPLPQHSARTVFIFFHENATAIQTLLKFRFYDRMSLGQEWFFAIEYPGYDAADETLPSSEAIKLVADFAMIFLKSVLPSDFRIVLVGKSLGTGPACHFASLQANTSRDPTHVILWTPYSSIEEVIADLRNGFFQRLQNTREERHRLEEEGDNSKSLTSSEKMQESLVSGLVSLVPAFQKAFRRIFSTDLFSNADYLSRCHIPVLFIHGTHDSMIPVDHSLFLGNVCHRAMIVVIQGAAHDDIDAASPRDIIDMFVYSELFRLDLFLSAPSRHIGRSSSVPWSRLLWNIGEMIFTDRLSQQPSEAAALSHVQHFPEDGKEDDGKMDDVERLPVIRNVVEFFGILEKAGFCWCPECSRRSRESEFSMVGLENAAASRQLVAEDRPWAEDDENPYFSMHELSRMMNRRDCVKHSNNKNGHPWSNIVTPAVARQLKSLFFLRPRKPDNVSVLPQKMTWLYWRSQNQEPLPSAESDLPSYANMSAEERFQCSEPDLNEIQDVWRLYLPRHIRHRLGIS